MWYVKGASILLAVATCTASYAAKPGSNTSGPQDVNVVNEVKLDPNQRFQMVMTDSDARWMFAGFTSASATAQDMPYSGSKTCRAEFTNGKVATGPEIRRAMDNGVFSPPTVAAAMFTADNGLNLPYARFSQNEELPYLMVIDTLGRITRPSSSHPVACSVPTP